MILSLLSFLENTGFIITWNLETASAHFLGFPSRPQIVWLSVILLKVELPALLIGRGPGNTEDIQAEMKTCDSDQEWKEKPALYNKPCCW